MNSGQGLDPALFDDPALADLVAKAMDIQDAGEELDLQVLCVDHPHLVGAVEASLHTGSQILSLQKGQAGFDRRKGGVLSGRYQLDQRLGAGAMGVVYGATDLDLGRKVAVKILRSGFLETNEAEQRFTREAEAMAAVTHPSVITVYDRGRTEEGEAFLVMELLEGASLGTLIDTAEGLAQSGQRSSTNWVAAALAGGRLDESTFLRAAIRWTADLASGLGAAHASGVYHRDVKPSNVFIRGNGTPVLLDFGIAARTDEHTITRDGSAVGTPAYMAPEAFSSDAAPGPALDVYSLSATLYHLLTDKAPYSGTPSQVIASLIADGPTPAYQLEPTLPRDVQAILDKGMARRVADRYRTVADLEADLRAFLDHQPVKARPISKVTRAWRKVRRMPVFWVLAAGLVLGTAGFAWRDIQRARAEADLVVYRDAVRRIPPNLVYGGLPNRVLTEVSGVDEVRAHLDRAVAHRAAVLPSVAVRAAFRLDHGDVSGAKSDLSTIAAELGSAYSRALSDRYGRLGSEARGADAVDLTDLPEPETADDVLLAAIHAFRAEDYGAFRALSRDSRLDESPDAELFRLLLKTTESAREAYEGVLAYEARNGGRSAQTAFQLGAALIKDQRYHESEAVLRQSLELAPHSFRTLENLGLARWCLGDHAQALEFIEESIRLNGSYPATQFIRARILLDLGQLDLVEEALAQAPRPITKRSRLWAMTLPSEIAVERAILQLEAGDADGARAAAAEALAQFRATEARWSKLGNDLLGLVRVRVGLAEAIVASDQVAMFESLLKMARRSGLRREPLNQALRFVPEDAPPEWRYFLRYLIAEHAPRFWRDPFTTPKEQDEPSPAAPK